MTLRCLAHIHTRFSFDSCLSPKRILSSARNRQIDVLIITDHNTLRGSLEVLRIADGNPRFVIVAGEYQTEKGDIIGLFLRDEITSRRSREVIGQIKGQGGLVLLPHPYKGHKLDDELLAEVDLIETFNARCSAEQNQKALTLAGDLRKPTLAGCDAHCAPELRSVTNVLDVAYADTLTSVREALLMAPRSIQTQKTSSIYQPFSQMIKAYKTRDVRLFLYQAKRMLSRFSPGPGGNGR